MRAVRASAFFAALLLASAAGAAEAVKFGEVTGWWLAEPTYGGETSRVALHLLEENGKPTAKLSLLPIGGYEVPLGEVTMTGNTLDTKPYSMPLTYDAKRGTLSGQLLEAAVPVHKIAVEFRRSAPIAAPTPPTWEYPRPRTRWTAQVDGAVWAGLAHDAHSGQLFVATERGTVHALDTSGKQRWSFATNAPIRARPAVIGDALYVASDNGFLYRLTMDGEERWRARVDAGSPARIPTNQENTRWDRYGSSVVSDGTRLFYASRDKHLYALNPANGSIEWKIAANDIMTATPALYRDLVLFAAFDGKVKAVRASDAQEAWTYDARLPVPGDLTIDRGIVYLGSRTYDLIALDAGTGRELWKHYYWFSWIESPAVVRDGVVYTGSSDATAVYALDAAKGTRLWKAHVAGWPWAQVAIAGDVVVSAAVGTGKVPGVRNGALTAMDARTGSIRWVYLDPPTAEVADARREWGFGAAPVAVADTVYAADLEGRVLALDARSD